MCLFWYREFQKLLCPALSLLAKNCDFRPLPPPQTQHAKAEDRVVGDFPSYVDMSWYSLFLANHSPGWSQERANQKAQLWVWLSRWLAGRTSNRQNRLLRQWKVRLHRCYTGDSAYWRSTRAVCTYKIKVMPPKGRMLGKLEVETAKQEQKCCHSEQRSRTTWLGQSSLISGNLCSSFRISYLSPSPRIPATVSILVCANPGAKHWWLRCP